MLLGHDTPHIGAEMVLPPASFEYIKTANVHADGFYGVDWTDNDEIHLSAGSRGVRVYDKDLKYDKTIYLLDDDEAFSTALIRDKLITQGASQAMKKYATYLGSFADPQSTLLHSEFHENPNKISHCSANEKYIAFADTVNKRIKIFSASNNKNLYDIVPSPHLLNPFGVCILSDVALVTYTGGKHVYKYSLTQKGKLIWVSDELSGQPSGITTDDSGFVYVSNNSSPNISVITLQGK